MTLNKTSRRVLVISSFILAGLSNQAWSENPENLPIQIEANQLESQDVSGITLYIGDVIVTQGETRLTGDQVEIHHPNRQLNSMTATGAPAHFKHFNELENTTIIGHAQTIIYFAQQRKVHLIGHAYLEQQNTHIIQGPKLIYDMENQTLNAGSTDQQTGRVTMTLTPQSDD